MPTRTMTYDDDNRLLKFNDLNVTVDDYGNLTVGPLTNNSSFANYTYDARNRLSQISNLQFTYDPSGNRGRRRHAGESTRCAARRRHSPRA